MRVNQLIGGVIRWTAVIVILVGCSARREALAVLVDLEGLGINADFEDPDADPANDGAEQTVARNLGPGWTYNLLGGHTSDFGVQDPADGYYGAHPLAAPLQGRQVGYINLEPFSAGEIVSNSIGTITAGQTYTLNVGVGARNNLTWSNQRYAIGLRVGSTDLGTFATVDLDPGATATVTSDLAYTLHVNAEAASFIGSDAKIVIRGINLGSFGSGTTPAFTQVNFDNVRLDGTFGAPNWPVLTINRATGNISLSKTGSANASIAGYTLTSAAGSLNSASWLSIANNYDKATAPTPGNGSVDGDDAWTILSQAGSKTNLAEGEVETGGNGGTLSTAAINLGNAWRKSPFQDVQATVSLADGTVFTPNVIYTGSAFASGDLNVDGNIDGLDWTTFKNAQGTNFTGLTNVEAYLAGDLDNDKDRDLNDFILFRTAYDVANGAGAFGSLLANVPEPTAGLLLIMGGLFMFANWRRQRIGQSIFMLMASQRAMLTLVGFAVLAFAAGPASAQTIAHWTFDAGSRTDNGTNITGFTDTSGNHNATNAVSAGSGTGNPFTSNAIPIANNIAGRFGDGLTLTGFNTVAGGGGQFLAYPNLNELTTTLSAGPNPSYTVSYWINTTTTNAQSLNLFSDWGNAATNPGRFTYGFGFDFNGTTPRMRGQSRNNTTGAGNGTDIFARVNTNVATGAANLNNGSWHMLTWTYDTTIGQLRSYFDATLIDTFNSTVTNFNMVRSSSAVGTWGLKGDTNGGGFLNGTLSLDEAWVLQGALSQTEVTTLFTSNTPPVPPAVLTLRVDPSTGQAQLRNTSGQNIVLNSYRITSNGIGSLNPSAWTPIAGQTISGFPSGNGSGNGWETPPSANNPADYNGNGVVDSGDYVLWRKSNINGTPGYNAWRAAFGAANVPPGSNKELVEWYLQGESTFTNGMQPINLGQAFNIGSAQDLGFQYTVGSNIVTGTVQYGSLGSGAGSGFATVPEPSSAWLMLAAAFAGSVYASRRRRYVAVPVSAVTDGRVCIRHLFSMLAVIAAVSSLGNSASAAYTLDRLYHFGDDPIEDAANATGDPDGAGPIGGDVGSGPANISPNNTFDSEGTLGQGEIIVMAANGATGKPKYIDVGVTGASLAQVRPGASPGNRGILFDGVDDFLNGLRFNNPNTAPGTVQYTPAGPNNYNGVFTRGFQLWVYPNSAASTVNQWIVRDTQQHGMGINNQGEWQLSYNNTTVDSNVHVNFNQWSHVTVAMPGSLPNREVLYVNGVAVAARQSNYTTSDAANAFSLVVGADTGDTAPTNGDSDRFNGVVDELEMYVWGSTYDVGTNTVTNLGQFSFATDDAYAASHLTATAGDVNQSGTLTQQDIDDFVANWQFQKLVNNVQVGDMTTIVKGDLNFDGITNLSDMAILRSAIAGSGSGSSFDLTALNNVGVPEPATWLLGAFSLGGFLASVRRKRPSR